MNSKMGENTMALHLVVFKINTPHLVVLFCYFVNGENGRKHKVDHSSERLQYGT